MTLSLGHFPQPSWEKLQVLLPLFSVAFVTLISIQKSWVAHIPLSYPGGIGDDIRDEGEGNGGISRDKLRTGEIPSCTQPVKGSDNCRRC